MTEQPPADDVEPRSVPETLGTSSAGPNDLTPPEWRGTAMIVWSLIGLMFAGGLLLMVLTWRDAGIPSLPEGPDFSFDIPELRFPDLESPIERRERREREIAPPPEMVEPSGPGDPRPVGEIDKPGGEGIPVGGEAGVLSGGNGKPD
jgi:hypothetical protein